MTTLTKVGVVIAALAIGATTTSAQPKPSAPNTADIADRIVGKTANVKPGEIVQITGPASDMALLEDLSIAVLKRGAFPIITVWSESAEKKLLASMPDTFDSKTNAADLALAKVVNVVISIPAVRDGSVWEKFPAARMQVRAKAYRPILDTMLKRNVRQIGLDNDLAPSAARAKTIGITETEMAAIFWAGIGADYAAIEARAKTIKELLSKSTELRITAPNGTDIKMKIKGRKINASDGVLSDADVKAGGVGLNAWLPAGEIILTPVPGTAEGKIVDDRMFAFEKEITGVTAEVKAGKITAITAKSGWDLVKPFYDAAGPGRDEIASFDLGINPSVKATAKLEAWMIGGMVSLTTGDNTFYGGAIKEPFQLRFSMTGTTVTLDGKPIVEAGVLK